MESLESKITAIESRNARVEADKAWETSMFRRTVIAVLTYIAIAVFFWYAGLPHPWANAVVPTAAFIISTLTMPLLKKVWLGWFYKK